MSVLQRLHCNAGAREVGACFSSTNPEPESDEVRIFEVKVEAGVEVEVESSAPALSPSVFRETGNPDVAKYASRANWTLKVVNPPSHAYLNNVVRKYVSRLSGPTQSKR